MAQYLWLRLLAQGTPQHLPASATTTSRSTAGAAPRSTTSCASRRIFRARPSIRLERNYRSTRAYPGRRLAPDRPQRERAWARRCGPRIEGGREGHHHAASGTARRRRALIGEEIEALQLDRATISAEIAVLVRVSASRCASSRSASSQTGVPYRVIGGPRFYERAGDPRRAWPICAASSSAHRRPRLRAHRQRAASGGLGDAAIAASLHRPRARQPASRCCESARRASSRPTS